MKNEDQSTSGAALPPHEQDALVFRLAVRRLREELGWSQNQLASELRKLGLEEFSQVAVARLERGERAVKLGEARVIASALRSTVRDMLAPEVSLTRGVQRAYKKILAVRRNGEELAKNTWRYENSKIGFLESLQELEKLTQAENNPTRDELRTIEFIIGKAEDGIGVPNFVGKSYVEASALDIARAALAVHTRGRGETQEYLDEVHHESSRYLNELKEYLSSHIDSNPLSLKQDEDLRDES